MPEINSEIKMWFIDKVARNPDYIQDRFMPELDKLIKKGEAALHQAIKNDGIEKIKYQMGWFDGVREIGTLLGVLKMSDGRKPAEPGLVARIFSIR